MFSVYPMDLKFCRNFFCISLKLIRGGPLKTFEKIFPTSIKVILKVSVTFLGYGTVADLECIPGRSNSKCVGI